MKERDFENFLIADSKIVSKTKAVRSRINKGRMIERHFDSSLDELVSDDKVMYKALLKVKSEMKDTNGNLSNSLRKYYQFANGRTFPSLIEYAKSNQ